MRVAFIILGLTLTGCAMMYPEWRVDTLPLGSESFDPIAMENVRLADPAPEGCVSVARLSTQQGTPNAEFAAIRLRERAAELGANVVVLDTQQSGTSAGGLSQVTYSGLALRCP